MKSTIKIFCLVLLCSTFSLAAATEYIVAKNSKCKLVKDAYQEKRIVNWHGPCLNGAAQGLGVVRYLKGSKVDSVFYGNVIAGAWEIGVHDTQDGYVAGRFENNKLVSVNDDTGMEGRNTIIKAFETAAKAALQLSQEFERGGNKASAKYYKAEAKKLSEQMD